MPPSGRDEVTLAELEGEETCHRAASRMSLLLGIIPVCLVCTGAGLRFALSSDAVEFGPAEVGRVPDSEAAW